jgi:hypothetical protein
MIIKTENGESFNTEKDLTDSERHLLQKLIIWESLVSSIDEFRGKRDDLVSEGWNNSKPIMPGEAMTAIISLLENKVIPRNAQKDVSEQLEYSSELNGRG